MLVFAAVVCEKQQENKTIQFDEKLFCKIGEGDKDAFCQLYTLTGNAVFSYALSILRNREDAEDAMQETFLKIRSAAHLYIPMGKPLAWILTITKNICMMKFRQAKYTAAIPLADLEEIFSCNDIEDREDRLILETAFRILSHKDCQIIILHAVAGLKHREISKLMDIPLSTILSRYHRGIKKLRAELEGIL